MWKTFDYWIDEYMIFLPIQSTAGKTLTGYEKTLRFFER